MITLEQASALIEVLELLTEKCGMTVDWTNNNILPYLQELMGKIVAYQSGMSIMWIVLGVVICIFGLILFIAGSIKDWDGFQWLWLIIGLVIGGAIICFNAETLIACNTFPEKVVFDYIQTLMNTAQ